MYKPEYMQRVRLQRKIDGKCQGCGGEKERPELENCDKCIKDGIQRKRINRHKEVV